MLLKSSKRDSLSSVSYNKFCVQLKAYTLIELMSAIAIVAILSASAVSSYSYFSSQANLTEVLSVINNYKDELGFWYHQNNEFPANFSSLMAANYTPISSSNTISLIYYDRSADNQNAYIQFFTQNTGIAGSQTADGAGSGAINSRLSVAFVTTANGFLRIYCGQWDGSTADIDLDYLPSSCRDTNLSSSF